MSQPNEKVHLSEMIGGLFVFGGIILGALRWWWGDTFWNSAGQAFLFLLTGGLITLLAEGLRTGKLGIKGGYVYRDKSPFVFWSFVLFYCVVGIGLLIGSVVYVLI